MKKTNLMLASAMMAVVLAAGPSLAAETKVAAEPQTAVSEGQGKKPHAGLKKLHEAMRKLHDENKASLVKIKKLREEMEALTRAATFDKTAYLAKHEEMRPLEAQIADLRAKTVAEALSTMTAEERASMPTHGPRGPERRPHRDGKGPHGQRVGDEAPDAASAEE